MAIWEAFRVAMEALWANKLRAILTMLGIIIGVMSVIVMVAIVQGARQKVVEQFEGNGSNLILAFYSPRPDSTHAGGDDGIHLGNISAIERQCPLIGAVSPTASTSVVARVGDNSSQAQLTGVLSDYGETNNLSVAEGRFLTDDDNVTWSKVCVIGPTISQKLFGTSDPIGMQIKFDNYTVLTVVGLLQEKDRGPGGTDFNNGVFTPIQTLQQRFTGNDHIDAFTTESLSVDETNAAADQVWAVLLQRHPRSIDDYIVDTQEGLLKQIDTVLNTFQLMLGGIAGLSLLTGGIGIMNIMLVSVTERTREIGIRKAVGATQGAILSQFVIEAVVVSGSGGLIGIAQGYAVAALIDHFAHKIVPTYVPFWAILIAFGFSLIVGLIFGIFPAIRASRLDPIAALRYE